MQKFTKLNVKTYQQQLNKLKIQAVDVMTPDIHNVPHHVHLHKVLIIANHLALDIVMSNVNHYCMYDVQMLSNVIHHLFV